MKTYLFPNDIEPRDYKVFPVELEQDPNVFFHGTALENLDSILSDGFIPDPPLESISYAKTSALALGYAASQTNGIIIAVRFSDLEAPGLLVETSIAYTNANPVTGERVEPTVLGICHVPNEYTHR